MHAVLKTSLLGILSYIIYNYIVIPLSSPELEDFRKHSVATGSWRSEDLVWFIHITDLHISKHHHPDIQEDLHEFFSTTLDTIKPRVVLASGDLTDGKDSDGIGSFQVKEEWEAYRKLLDRNNVTKKTLYLDIRGNHDSFDVHSFSDKNNYFRTHSGIRGRGRQNSSYLTTINQAGTNYSFVAVDATLNPGPKKVFNFLGFLSDQKLAELARLRNQARLSSDTVVYFGHFPSSCIVSDVPVMEMLEGGIVYLSGHLHTLGGLAPHLYTLHHSGTPELELGDWKENRRFRVLAIDNGVLSFTDVKHGDWPVILITNPKNSKYIAPRVEKLENILVSNIVRVIAFSPHGISSVSVRLNKEDWKLCHKEKENVYTVQWDPAEYVGSTNLIKVEVVDGFGDTTEISQSFVVEQDSVTSLSYSLYARLILQSRPYSLLVFLWLAGFCLCSLPLLLARYFPARLDSLIGTTLTRGLRLVAKHKFLFNVYMFTSVFVTFGPWHIGEILTGHIGYVFAWATVVRGTILPSFYPYVFSLVHLFFFHFPLLWSLVFKLQWRLGDSQDSRLSLALTNIPITLVLSCQAILLIVLYFYPSKLGIFKEICLILAPVEISTIIIGFLLNGVVSFHIREGAIRN